MNETDFENLLADLLQNEDEVRRVQTFEEAGLLTNDRGVVVHTADGSTFQISIVQSR
ncbi:MAG: hypothetical protein BWX88_05056 [Planctomycetes bacterium ADurb.Bin126]|nr:MAG: hypothetical protein BWX88_05056 [Planctomycetes bacterium ADurb.Bin126]HOD84530.1 hypothetical protein [Phycisphaerae bacterium]HQL76318.1 hypothetical protein [Phycisphaerae bacterium]